MLYATHARVHLDRIAANLAQVRDRVGPGVAVLAAVKANAYGHGAVPVARMLQETTSADWLGVATVPEGLELRAARVGLPILKLSHCFPDEVEAAVQAGLTLTVVDESTIRDAERAAAALGRVSAVHLKVDTGMRRIGVEPAGALALARLVDASAHLRLEGVFTHMPAADVPEQDAFTAAEIARFAETESAIEAERGPVPLVHCANSAGVLAHPSSTFSLVRPGIMTYGYYPDASTPRTLALQPALELVSRVSFVKRVAAGESVSYGRTWVAPADTTIATVPIGYADGYSRLLSNRGHALVGGRRVPVVGRVCMGQVMLGLGAGAADRAGDEVVLIGRQGEAEVSCDEVAGLTGSITYEVTSLLTPRVTRVYLP